jgi:hypothetical protein
MKLFNNLATLTKPLMRNLAIAVLGLLSLQTQTALAATALTSADVLVGSGDTVLVDNGDTLLPILNDAQALQIQPIITDLTSKLTTATVAQKQSYIDAAVKQITAIAPNLLIPPPLGKTSISGDLGAIVSFARTTCPINWLEANGQNLPIISPTPPYVNQGALTLFVQANGGLELYQQPGTAYTYVKLPDLRGEFIRGWDHGRGVDPGRLIGTLNPQAQSLPSQTGHTHHVGMGGSHHFLVEGRDKGENRPRNLAFLQCIKVK